MTTPAQPESKTPRTRRSKKKTAKQRDAGKFLELYGVVHFLFTEQRCPVMFEGKLAYVRCPGVNKEAFKRAIAHRVIGNLMAYCKDNPPRRRAAMSREPKEGKAK